MVPMGQVLKPIETHLFRMTCAVDWGGTTSAAQLVFTGLFSERLGRPLESFFAVRFDSRLVFRHSP
jgi:hypothetical protein